ncbi:MAG: asparagine synthase (glutamine-hydrolyzing) [Planctomycetota bacterium]
MCGITGIILKDKASRVDAEAFRAMTCRLSHRGPDDEGVYLSRTRPNVALGHRRLSIIDLAGGHQPLANESGTVHVVFNGEIYNFRDLRRDLEAGGHIFRTRSDTETLVHLYEEHGSNLVEHLRGMFAFAIYDEERARLVLARDRLGQKPLCYYHGADRLVFASEIAGIVEEGGAPRVLDEVALDEYLTYQYVPAPRTMFAHVKKLPPASVAVFENDSLDIRRYWSPPFEEELHEPEERIAARLRDALFEATELRMISDVPIAAFLSGGIDSTVTVGVMSRLSKDPVHTFSIGFRESLYDESRYARIAARAFRTDHEELIVEPSGLEVLPTLVERFGEPFADSSAIPTYHVARVTSRRVKVALTGDAGDECFAGYPRYKAVKLASWFDRLGAPARAMSASRLWQLLPASVEQKTIRRRLKKLMQALALPPELRYLRWIEIFPQEQKLGLYSPDLAERLAGQQASRLITDQYARAARRDFLTATTLVDLMTYLPHDLLVKVDIASMANGLEARSPFLDHKVVELATRIPMRLKLRGWESKYILKRAFADLIPPEIASRPKMGFGVPIAEWFRNEYAADLRKTLLDGAALSRRLFRGEAVARLIEDHTSRRFDHGYRLWALLMLELWARRFLR